MWKRVFDGQADCKYLYWRRWPWSPCSRGWARGWPGAGGECARGDCRRLACSVEPAGAGAAAAGQCGGFPAALCDRALPCFGAGRFAAAGRAASASALCLVVRAGPAGPGDRHPRLCAGARHGPAGVALRARAQSRHLASTPSSKRQARAHAGLRSINKVGSTAAHFRASPCRRCLTSEFRIEHRPADHRRAGILGLAVGFGAQTLVRDIISGFFLILEDQVRVGDAAAINGVAGTSKRSTCVRSSSATAKAPSTSFRTARSTPWRTTARTSLTPSSPSASRTTTIRTGSRQSWCDRRGDAGRSAIPAVDTRAGRDAWRRRVRRVVDDDEDPDEDRAAEAMERSAAN